MVIYSIIVLAIALIEKELVILISILNQRNRWWIFIKLPQFIQIFLLSSLEILTLISVRNFCLPFDYIALLVKRKKTEIYLTIYALIIFAHITQFLIRTRILIWIRIRYFILVITLRFNIIILLHILSMALNIMLLGWMCNRSHLLALINVLILNSWWIIFSF